MFDEAIIQLLEPSPIASLFPSIPFLLFLIDPFVFFQHSQFGEFSPETQSVEIDERQIIDSAPNSEPVRVSCLPHPRMELPVNSHSQQDDSNNIFVTPGSEAPSPYARHANWQQPLSRRIAALLSLRDCLCFIVSNNIFPVAPLLAAPVVANVIGIVIALCVAFRWSFGTLHLFALPLPLLIN
jgi:hypothetical protein